MDAISQTTYNQTKHWLQYWHSHHQSCARSRTSCSPTRLIDVGELDGFSRLIESDARSGHSLCSTQFLLGHEPIRQDDDWEHQKKLSKQLPVSVLQQTLKDAMWTTRELGRRLLWSDSLCVIPDSDDDMMAQELSRVREVYVC